MSDIDLITGASGLLGGNLARILHDQGRRVRILVRRNSRLGHLEDLADLQKVVGDILLPESLELAMEAVDTVYHCAAQVSVSRRMTPSLWQTNVVGTENVLQAFKRSSARRLVHCSSVDAIGLPEGDAPSTEATPWNWDRLGVETAYARSKYESQLRVLQAARQGINAVVVCPAYMFGPYDMRPSSGQMILSVQRSLLLPKVTGGNNFIDVRDVVDGMVAAAQVGEPGELYILGHMNLSYEQVFRLICAVLGKKYRSVSIPPFLLSAAGRLGDGVEMLTRHGSQVNSAVARLGQVYHYYDSTRAIHELGLPQRPLEPAVARTVDWFRKTGMLPAP